MEPITIARISVAHEEGVLTVGIFVREAADSEALLLQLADAFDEQDHHLGMDTYSVVTDQGASWYGGVTRCHLEGGVLSLGFSRACAKALGLHTSLSMRIPGSPEQVDALAEGLRRIFSGPKARPRELNLST